MAPEVMHSPECLKAEAAYDKERRAFEKKYPNYCRACQGWGSRVYRFDPSPAGMSLSPGYMEDWEPCTECVEKGKCPRCGSPLFEKRNKPDTLHCRKCKWNTNEKFEGIPERPECECYFSQVEEQPLFD